MDLRGFKEDEENGGDKETETAQEEELKGGSEPHGQEREEKKGSWMDEND